MPENIRALIVVLLLSAPAFYVASRIAPPTMSPREFAVWRNAWFAATIVAFVFTNYFIYACFTVLLCIYLRAARSASPGAFFLLLFAVPIVNISIGGFGLVNSLLDINNPRLLALVLLLPMLFAVPKDAGARRGKFTAPDVLICSYVGLVAILELRDTEATNVLRVATTQTLDVLLPYFALSRAVRTSDDFRKAMLAIVIATLPFSLMAVFETVKSWRLYGAVGYAWEPDHNFGSYLQRDGLLRSAVVASNPITLGLMFLTALGAFLVVRQSVRSKMIEKITFVLIVAGLLAALSRGPWVAAAVLTLVFISTGKNAGKVLIRSALVGVILLVPLSFTPVGSRLMEFLPFVGTIDSNNVEYRQRLVDNSLVVLNRNLLFGNPNYMSAPEMQDLKQGGMIDIVNSYVGVALNSGVAGLTLFVGFFVSVLMGLWRVRKLAARHSQELAISVRASLATLIAILLTIGTTSSVDFVAFIYWSIAGLSVALVRVVRREAVVAMTSAEYRPKVA
jgi:hypothetical protein